MAVDDWLPTVDAVGAVLRSRTKDDRGNELGTFTDRTRPTSDQVQELLRGAVDDLQGVVYPNIPSRFWRPAANLVALRAALTVELSFFPEQINTGRSPYTQLKQLFDEAVPRLKAQIEESSGDVSGQTEMRPKGGFAGRADAGLRNPTSWTTQW